MKPYKVIVVNSTSLGSLEDVLNAAADDGYEFVHGFENNMRHVIVMREKPKVGRPSKSDKGE